MSHPVIGWLNPVHLENVYRISVILLTSHWSTLWLKDVATLNKPYKFVALSKFQAFRLPLLPILGQLLNVLFRKLVEVPCKESVAFNSKLEQPLNA